MSRALLLIVAFAAVAAVVVAEDLSDCAACNEFAPQLLQVAQGSTDISEAHEACESQVDDKFQDACHSVVSQVDELGSVDHLLEDPSQICEHLESCKPSTEPLSDDVLVSDEDSEEDSDDNDDDDDEADNDDDDDEDESALDTQPAGEWQQLMDQGEAALQTEADKKRRRKGKNGRRRNGRRSRRRRRRRRRRRSSSKTRQRTYNSKKAKSYAEMAAGILGGNQPQALAAQMALMNHASTASLMSSPNSGLSHLLLDPHAMHLFNMGMQGTDMPQFNKMNQPQLKAHLNALTQAMHQMMMVAGCYHTYGALGMMPRPGAGMLTGQVGNMPQQMQNLFAPAIHPSMMHPMNPQNPMALDHMAINHAAVLMRHLLAARNMAAQGQATSNQSQNSGFAGGL